MSFGDHLMMTSTQPAITSHIPTVSQRHLSGLEGTHLSRDRGTDIPSLSSKIQCSQQVTNLSATLSDTPFVSRPVSSIGTANCSKMTSDNPASTPHRGKAPPIDPFTAEDITITFDDWLLTLERAASWNGWTPEESLMQLAGHLRGRASQEWKLLLPENRTTYQAAVRKT